MCKVNRNRQIGVNLGCYSMDSTHRNVKDPASTTLYGKITSIADCLSALTFVLGMSD